MTDRTTLQNKNKYLHSIMASTLWLK